MKKISLSLSLLFIFGQVLMPSLSVSATTLTNKNESAIIENVDKSNETNMEVKAESKEEIKNENENSEDQTNEVIVEESKDNTEESNDTNSEETEESKEKVENEPSESLDQNEQINSEENSTKSSDEVAFGEEYETIKKPKATVYAKNAEFAVQETDRHYEKEEYAADMNALEDIEYLVNKTGSNFEVVLSMGDGVYQFVDSANTIEEAMDLANSSDIVTKRTSKAKSDLYLNAIPSVIDRNGVVVYSTNAMGRILKHYKGVPYYGSDIVTYLYKDYSSTASSNYINQGYVDDTPIIEDRGNRAKIQVAGYVGWINKDTSAEEYDMIVVPLNNVKNPSYYENVNGELSHWISQDITTVNKGSIRKLGPAPSFMKPGVKYYSYDGNYFYTDLNTLISDSKAGHKNNSVNGNQKFYAYYQTLPFRSKTVYSASDLDNFINANTIAGNKLRGTGQAFINAQNKYGVNAATMLGIAINESGWGKSNLAVTKNNLFGLEAYDSNPNDAKAFASVEQCIDEFANYWISRGYTDPQDSRYYGGFLGGKALGANVKYASDPFWGEKAASNGYENDKYLSGSINSLRDYNSNVIGIITGPTKVIKKDGSNLYTITSTLEYNASFVGTPIVLSSTEQQYIAGKAHYSINPERTTSLSLSGGDEFIGTYDWNIKGYIESNKVNVINSKPVRGLNYKAHVRDKGWLDWVNNGDTAGVINANLGLEALTINSEGLPSGMSIRYKSHVQDLGWLDWVSAGEMSGTTGKAKYMEAIVIEASSVPKGNILLYRAYVQGQGWQEWKSSGQTSGTTGQNKKIEAIEIKLVESDEINVVYSTHVMNDGWLNEVSNGTISGTMDQGKRVEAMKINVNSEIPGVGIMYRAHVQDIGWQDWVAGGTIAGTTGARKQVEAVQVMLTGVPAGYHVEYKTYVQGSGWQDWVRDGAISGTTGKNKRIEAIQIRVRKPEVIDVVYSSHVKEDGWLKDVSNGELSGTTGENKRVEAFKINTATEMSGVGIKYRAHVQDLGWQDWVYNGQVAGTTGKAKQVEAVQIQLTGVPAGYHVEYRVHVQDLGWQNWVMDGQVAGTTGKNKQIEAIEIKVVKD